MAGEAMQSVRILYDVPNWAYFQVAEALRKYAPSEFDVTPAHWPQTAPQALDAALGPEQPDFVIVNQFRDAPCVRAHIEKRGWNTCIVCFWNVGWPRRTEYLASTLAAADGIIFINEEYWRNIGQPPHCVCIPHGADLDVFEPRLPVAQRPRRILWLGSEVNRTVKGYDQIIAPLETRLCDLGFECDFRLLQSNDGGPLGACAMADWYNSGRILLCASTSEGTPNVALEAAACGCVPVSTPVGNMPELIRHGDNGLIVEASVDAFVEAVQLADSRCSVLSEAILNDIRAWGWDVLAPKVFDFVRQVGERGTTDAGRRTGVQEHGVSKTVSAGRRGGRDIGSELTVFVTTVGAQTFEACVHLLEQQDCRFGLRIIRDVAPLSAAFQRMLDDCGTPYYVQVDEDMLLYPHAVRTLYERMLAQPGNTAIHTELLFDTHVRMNIDGVKVFRHAIVKHFPFADVEGCDVDQNERLAAAGFALSRGGRTGGDRPHDGTLGLHGTAFTPEAAFYRYLKLSRMARRAKHVVGWENLAIDMARRVVEECTPANVYALLGAMAGQVAPMGEANGEKHFREQARSEGFQALNRFHARISNST
jgi:glycosyltransferase involved in cell wall biosynthesis